MLKKLNLLLSTAFVVSSAHATWQIDSTGLFRPEKISTDGQVMLGKQINGAGRYQSAVRSVASGTTTFVTIFAQNINGDGSVVCGSHGLSAAFETSAGITTVSVPGGRAVFFDVSDNALAATGKVEWPGGSFQAFRWDAPNTVTLLPYPTAGNNESNGLGISKDGTMVVGNSQTKTSGTWIDSTPVSWIGGSFATLSFNPLTYKAPLALSVNGDGAVVGGSASLLAITSTYACKWVSGTFTVLSWPAESSGASGVKGINTSGDVLVGIGGKAGGGYEAFIEWYGASSNLYSFLSSLFTVGITNWATLDIGHDISGNGSVIIGEGRMTGGVSSGFIARQI